MRAVPWVKRAATALGWPGLASVGVVLAVRAATAPRTPWEADEFLFLEGVRSFQPLLHHPHPPGYPLTIGLGKVFALLVGDPFASLVVVSILAAAVALVAFAAAFRPVLEASFGRERAWLAALGAALMVSLSPALLVHGPLALSDPPALAFAALALFSATPAAARVRLGRAALAGGACAAAVGCRPQLAVPLAAVAVVVLVRAAGWRPRLAFVASAAVVGAAWIVPLVSACGGWARFVTYETAQATYVARHDAGLSRGGREAADILLRFVAHPWGPKWLSVPVLALAAFGAYRLVRTRAAAALPIVAFATTHLAFCLVAMDPADGVRYAIPAMPAVALAAVAGCEFAARRRWAMVVAAALLVVYAGASLAYVRTIIVARVTSASPPVQAARWAAANLPPDTVVLYEMHLKPHAQTLFAGHETVPVIDGWAKRPEQAPSAFVLFADREASARDGFEPAVFAWPDSDAYGKLTRNHYRVVTVLRLPRWKVYRAGTGFFPIERSPKGAEWRWVAPLARFAMTDWGCGSLRLMLALAPESPIDANRVEVAIDGRPVGSLDVERGFARPIVLPVRSGGVFDVELKATRSFVPAEHGVNADPRRLAAQAITVMQVCP